MKEKQILYGQYQSGIQVTLSEFTARICELELVIDNVRGPEIGMANIPENVDVKQVAVTLSQDLYVAGSAKAFFVESDDGDASRTQMKVVVNFTVKRPDSHATEMLIFQ